MTPLLLSPREPWPPLASGATIDPAGLAGNDWIDVARAVLRR